MMKFRSISVNFNSMYFFFLLQSLDVRGSENLFDRHVFQLDLL